MNLLFGSFLYTFSKPLDVFSSGTIDNPAAAACPPNFFNSSPQDCMACTIENLLPFPLRAEPIPSLVNTIVGFIVVRNFRSKDTYDSFMEISLDNE